MRPQAFGEVASSANAHRPEQIHHRDALKDAHGAIVDMRKAIA